MLDLVCHSVITNYATLQVYIWRAVSLSKLLQYERRDMIPAGVTYINVIDDYCKAHELKPNTDAIVEAILVAVDHDCGGFNNYV